MGPAYFLTVSAFLRFAFRVYPYFCCGLTFLVTDNICCVFAAFPAASRYIREHSPSGSGCAVQYQTLPALASSLFKQVVVRRDYVLMPPQSRIAKWVERWRLSLEIVTVNTQGNAALVALIF